MTNLPANLVAMIEMFDEEVKNNPLNDGMFFSSMFNREFVHETDEISIDVMRATRDVAVQVIPGTGGNLNDYGRFTEKIYKLPMYDEYVSMNVSDGFTRSAGENPINPSDDFEARVIKRALSAQTPLINKIYRAKELQATQALLDGKIALKYAIGGSMYVDFHQKSTHNVNVSTAWSNTAADAIGDIEAMCRVVAGDAIGSKPKVAVFGSSAWRNFNKNTEFNTKLDQLNRNQGGLIRPEWKAMGGVFHGTFTFGSYELELWTYEGKYNDPTSGDLTYYMPEDKVLIIDPDARRDVHYAAVPVFQMLEEAKMRAFNMFGMFTAVPSKMLPYMDVDMKAQANIAGVRSRPLYIPHDIDAHGVIDTTVA